MTSPNPYRRPNPRELLGANRTKPSEAVKWLQFELQRLNLYIGRIDGLFGYQTSRAVHQAQKKFRLRMDGIVNQELLDRLEG